MRENKIVYIISDIDKALAFEWIAEHLSPSHNLSFILVGKHDTELGRQLKSMNLQVSSFEYSGGIHLVSVFIKILWYLTKNRPNVVHTHLIKANVLGLTAAWLIRIKKRIYTRHHALVHHREHLKGLWQDKWCNYIATDIIAISKNVKRILEELEYVSPQKIHLIHHGFNLKYFSTISQHLQRLKEKYKIAEECPVIGVVARYQAWKGIQYIIPAFKEVLRFYPRAHLILANALGSYQDHIQQILKELPPNSFTQIAFENDSSSLFKIFDVYVHTPVDAESEAFGQTYVEALAVGIPSIFTMSGVAPEFIVHEQNALVVPFKDSEAIYLSIKRLLSDMPLREKLIENGKLSSTLFSLEKMTDALERLYEA